MWIFNPLHPSVVLLLACKSTLAHSRKSICELAHFVGTESHDAPPSIATKTINAMSETVAEKPAFRDALHSRRCLIPTDGFYEWLSIGAKQKQPFSIGMVDDSVFAFAGLWDSWRDASGQFLETCTILTTRPNPLVTDVHNRMPVILDAQSYDLWLDPKVKNPSLVAHLLTPFDATRMKKYPVDFITMSAPST